MGRHRTLFHLTMGCLIAATALFLSAPLWLAAMGNALVVDDGPAPADLAVVLGGDSSGGRILRAAELIRQGYVPAALISGPDGVYGGHECDYAIAYAADRGYPPNWFLPFPHEAHSTKAEALLIVRDLERRHLRRILVVTSDFHTRRASRIFRAASRALKANLAIRMVAVRGKAFRPASWWKSREGQEVAFLEWSKTITGAFGL